MKKRTSLVRTLFAAVLLVTFLTANLTPVVAVTWSDVNELKDQSAELDAQKDELEDKLDGLASDKSRALERKKLLDQKIDVLVAQVRNVEKQIAEYDTLIVQTQAELDEAQQREAAQYKLFCQRVRAMEENGKVSYLSVLFKASDFTDLLSRMDFINEVMEYDRGVIAGLKTLQEEIGVKKADLETQRKEEEDAKGKLLTQKSQLDVQRKEANALVKEIEANEQAYQGTLDDIAAEEEAIQKEIVELSRKLAAQNNQGNAALGGYIWPVPSKRITSSFGGRASPGGVGSTNHKGVDIGGVGYTTEIQAAKAGTVIVSQYSSSYGNYVVVSHGGGNTTLYAHMSSRKVSVGDAVSQGSALGITGSTGHSTGPHLHFEITENGNRVNPLTYLTGYVMAG